ncbi:hypothetical protein [Nocardioides sp. W7]|uniref:hypothetical protein n=1 Tax=Nocardioides sp. W7 TaxID=2931390 RepID=UPI001FD2539B|nr:hypothetical protein [Nocardioides sp. W7]
MSDQHPHDHDREDDVRRLLAEARHHEPMPVDVAARLDRVLDQLAAEDPADQAPVADLETHRRRRRARNLLVAAAAVAVVGIGLGQLDLTSSTSNVDAGGDESAGSSSIAADADQPSGAAEASPATPDNRDLAAARSALQFVPMPAAPEPLVVEDADFASADRLRALRKLTLGSRRAMLRRSLADAPQVGKPALGASLTCQPGPYGDGRLVAVQYDGHPAVLAIRPATGDSAVVELLRCGSAAVLRSATVPLP